MTRGLLLGKEEILNQWNSVKDNKREKQVRNIFIVVFVNFSYHFRILKCKCQFNIYLVNNIRYFDEIKKGDHNI